MRLLEFTARIAVGWLVVSVIVAGAWAIACARLKTRSGGTRVALYPPPVPKPRHYADDLLADLPVPVDMWLTPELSDRLFDDLIAMEGLS